ncbi:hypothetical protein N7533_013124 [Penicillium manginii]|uniref:uncharacterized protein n=1 Tax=Penicillium manginii TaxID=203109 RepID=UPI00254768DF|nr:uncharacterized protein N7533_013124 [Penicillium manginii]KAJ5734721.1 hypothetical protein N7533_013124 [Penicillium manginii]
MDSERDPSIFSLVALCVREFNALLASVPSEEIETRLKLQDDLGRLRVWIGNFGAHRKQTDRLSLDHRLREAPELHQEVRNHINDISEAIYGATSVIQESEKPFEDDETPPTSETNELDSDDSDSDGFWDQIKSENEKHSKLEEYLHDVQYIITSLYKFSVTLQNPAHRDRTAQASRIDLDHFEFYDVQHVSEKFKLPRDSILAQRLGKANTKRRQLLAYHKDHAQKISKYVDVAMEKTHKTTKDHIKHNDLDMSRRGPQSISTKWTQDTTVSTINHQDIEVASNSGQTEFSATTSTAGNQAHELMPPPPVDVVNKDQNSLFVCPYCRQMIQLENADEGWKYHVLSDLRPYICTFGNCVKANQLYDSYTEWSEHEQQFHRREWFCNLCLSNYQSETFFLKHLEDAHAGAIPEDQRRALVKLSTSIPAASSAASSAALYFCSPLPESEENEHSTRDGESNESRKALMVDGEVRESPKSTSTWSEGSSPYDQPEVIEGENWRGLGTQLDDDERTMLSGHSSTLKDIANLKSIFQSPGQSQKAENLEEDVLKAREYMLGKDQPGSLEDMTSRAWTFMKQGWWEEAEQLLMQVLDMSKKKLGEDHPDTLSSMADLASTFMEQGRWDEAEQLQVQLLGIRKKKLGEDHLDTLSSMADLASTFMEQHRWKEAEQLQVQVLEMRKKKLGEDHPDTLSSMADLASTFMEQDQWDEAEQLQVQVLEIRKKKLGEDHPDTLNSMADLALTFTEQGRLEEAEQLQVQVLAISKTQLSEDHPDTLSIMTNLASTFMEQGLLEEAKQLQVQVLEIRKKKLGEDHPKTLRSMANLASTLVEQGQWEEAEQLQVQVLEMRKKKLGEDHPDTLRSMTNLALMYRKLGRQEEAKQLYQRVLASYEKNLGLSHPSTIDALNHLGLLYFDQGKVKEAEEMYQRALAVNEKVLSSNHICAFDTFNNLGVLYSYQGKLKEAEEMYQQALAGYEKLLGPDHSATRQLVERLNAFNIADLK